MYTVGWYKHRLGTTVHDVTRIETGFSCIDWHAEGPAFHDEARVVAAFQCRSQTLRLVMTRDEARSLADRLLESVEDSQRDDRGLTIVKRDFIGPNVPKSEK